jgi:hypothetical protein
LFGICNSAKSSVVCALDLYNMMYCKLDLTSAKEYIKLDRISLCKSFNLCDAIYIKKQNQKTEILLRSF